VKSKLHLFPPPPATRWRTYEVPAADFSRSTGDNPPYGAAITFNLPAKSKEVKLEILGPDGKPVAKLTSEEKKKEAQEDLGAYAGRDDKKKPLPKEAGLHRVAWDLRYEGAKKIVGAVVDAGDPEKGPLALPGEYTLKLTADGKTATTTLKLGPDPRLQPANGKVTVDLPVLAPTFAAALSAVAPRRREELNEQHTFLMQVRDDIDKLTLVVKQLRAVRKQLSERIDLLKDEKPAKPLVDAAKKAAEKLDALEAKLHNPKAKTVYDILAQKGGARLYSQFTSLYQHGQDSDGAPTQGMKEVHADLRKELNELFAEWQALESGEVAKFNEQAKKLDLPGLWVPKAEKK